MRPMAQRRSGSWGARTEPFPPVGPAALPLVLAHNYSSGSQSSRWHPAAQGHAAHAACRQIQLTASR
jgi:hypothetical protein